MISSKTEKGIDDKINIIIVILDVLNTITETDNKNDGKMR